MRTWIAVACAAVFLVLVWASMDPNAQGMARWRGLAENVASEVFGILATVAIIDVLIDRAHRKEEARKIALRMLFDLDHAVWLWLGGKREYEVGAMQKLLEQVGDKDQPEPFTETLLIHVGSHAASALRTRPRLRERFPELAASLDTLIPLAGLRDDGPAKKTSPGEIAGMIAGSLAGLRAAAGIQAAQPDGAERLDASAAGQRWRHSGQR